MKTSTAESGLSASRIFNDSVWLPGWLDISHESLPAVIVRWFGKRISTFGSFFFAPKVIFVEEKLSKTDSLVIECSLNRCWALPLSRFSVQSLVSAKQQISPVASRGLRIRHPMKPRKSRHHVKRTKVLALKTGTGAPIEIKLLRKESSKIIFSRPLCRPSIRSSVICALLWPN